MSRAVLKRSLRILALLAIVAAIVLLGVAGWFAWQDRTYAKQLKDAHAAVTAQNSAEIDTAF